MIRNALRTGCRQAVSRDPLVRCPSLSSIRNAFSSARQAPATSTSSTPSAWASPTSTSTKNGRRRRRKTAAFSTTTPSVVSLATGNDAEARRALFREAVADAAGALYSTLLTDDGASAEVFPPAKLEQLQDRLGFRFPREHSWLLRAALVHKSYKAESGKYAASDLLSWHGDAVLYSMLTEATVAAFPGAGIPDLTAARQRRISRDSLSVVARGVGLGDLVVVGKCYQNIGGSEGPSGGMLAESIEAVLGAVSASGGTDAVRGVYFRIAPLPESGKLRDLMAEAMAGGGGGG